MASSDRFATYDTPSGFPMAILINSGAFYGVGEVPRSTVELKLMKLAAEIRNKREWWIKIRDPAIVNRWREEFTSTTTDDEPSHHPRMFDFVLAECQWLADQYHPGPSRPAAVDGVFARDDLSEQLREKLLQDIQLLRSRPAVGHSKEDRHPGTPQMVDLIHPSLYCYKRGQTPSVSGLDAEATNAPPWDSFIGNGQVIVEGSDVPDPDNHRMKHLKRMASQGGHQWLPSEVQVTTRADGSLSCQFRSYINNLHPKQYPRLYGSLGELFCHALPLLEDVLAEVGTGQEPRERPRRVPVRGKAHETPNFELPTYSQPKEQVHLRDRPLQVIVKIATLEIAGGQGPNRYEGGVWHVGGALDERIVATACCYLENVNVVGGDLNFRTAVREPSYEQYDHEGVWLTYGLKNDEPLVQDRGHCETIQGRVLAWPNTLQHRVDSVSLVDSNLPGKRTICCFFLVDPTIRVRSTATVPPQQQEWMTQEVTTALLPKIEDYFVRSKIASYVPGFMSYEEACERRDRLMDERRQIFNEGNRYEGKFYERIFSLCEH